jgi:hypothetical protein
VPRDLAEAPVEQVVELLLDDARGQRLRHLLLNELDPEAFLQSSAPDAGRLERLDEHEDLLDPLGRHSGRLGHFVHGRLEVPVLVDRADEVLAEDDFLFGALGEAELVGEMIPEALHGHRNALVELRVRIVHARRRRRVGYQP